MHPTTFFYRIFLTTLVLALPGFYLAAFLGGFDAAKVTILVLASIGGISFLICAILSIWSDD